jgi:UDP-N-acetylmuramate dehydrogenase
MELIQGFETILRENEPLAPYTRLRIGGVAEYFAEPTSIEQLSQLVQRFREAGLPVRLLGGGSNVLVRDEGVPGLVIHLAAPAFCKLQAVDNQLVAGGGTRLSHFVSVAIANGFVGTENLVGIPGTIGGALHGNAGNQHAGIGSWIQQATAVTRKGEVVTRERSEMDFGYRESSLTELVIVDATFRFEVDDPEKLTRRMQTLWIVKRSNEQAVDENSVYVFKDECGELAGRLIDQAGLKGTRIGDVQISSRDCNFFIAGPQATSDDVLRLIDLVVTRVSDRLGIELKQSLVVW